MTKQHQQTELNQQTVPAMAPVAATLGPSTNFWQQVRDILPQTVLPVLISLAFVALGILYFLNASRGHSDAPYAEGQQLLGSARDFLRVQYSKSDNPHNVELPFACAIESGEFRGQYFEVVPEIEFLTGGTTIRAVSKDDEWGSGSMRFEWATGKSVITWDYPLGRQARIAAGRLLG